MASPPGRKPPSRKQLLHAVLAEERPAIVDEAAWHRLQTRLAPISHSYLRRLLIAEGVPLAILIGGVRQGNLDELAETLLALEREYTEAMGSGNQPLAYRCRELVQTAQEHARFAVRRLQDATRRAEREEMLLWMGTWLENPGVFPEWLRLRRRG